MNPESHQKITSKAHSTRLLKHRWLSKKTVEIELNRPADFTFIPGQRIRFIYKAREKDYSLISTPEDSTLLICVRNVENGFFSPFLSTATAGAQFRFTGPLGYFTFRASPRPSVFIATGTGIAPFVSMGRSGVKGFTLLHGVQTPDDLYYASLFRSIAKAYIPCLSDPTPKPSWPDNSFSGRVTGYLEKYLPSLAYEFYLCGRNEMIRDVTLLVDERFPDSFIHTEIFY